MDLIIYAFFTVTGTLVSFFVFRWIFAIDKRFDQTEQLIKQQDYIIKLLKDINNGISN